MHTIDFQSQFGEDATSNLICSGRMNMERTDSGSNVSLGKKIRFNIDSAIEEKDEVILELENNYLLTTN